jgi:hypothetical protein
VRVRKAVSVADETACIAGCCARAARGHAAAAPPRSVMNSRAANLVVIERYSTNNEPTGKLIALQIKTGASYFRPKGDDFVFYGELRHLEYWTRHSLPMFLVLHDPSSIKATRTTPLLPCISTEERS